LLVFGAAVQSGSMGIIVAFIGVLTSVVGLYYYLNVLKIAFMGQSTTGTNPLPVNTPFRVALLVCVIGILFMGTVFGPWFTLSSLGSLSLF